MKLLVTGGAGFIGANFILYWLDRYPDDEIVNFDALTYAGNLENLAEVTDHPHYRFVKGNICDASAVEAVMEGMDVVIHFAAESHVDRSILSPTTFVDTNVAGTLVLLESAKKHQTRFHHISTDEVFGSLAFGSHDKFTRDSPYKPNSPYSASKAGSDHLVRAYHTTYGLPVTISNCSNNFGPYQFPEKLIPLVITNLMENKPVPIYGQGNQIRDWLYVTDHCRAIDLILHQGVIGETYLVGGQTEEITNLEVVKKIVSMMGKSESAIQLVTDRPGHDVRYAVDWSQTRDQLGYQPEYSFDEYLQKTVDWYVSHEAWWQRIKSGEYVDYYRQQYNNS